MTVQHPEILNLKMRSELAKNAKLTVDAVASAWITMSKDEHWRWPNRDIAYNMV